MPESDFPFDKLQGNPDPEVDFSAVGVPHHLTKELMSYFPKAKSAGSRMLDIGCGDAVHQRVCEHAGFDYVGLDYQEPEALLLGDAQSMPFKDESFEFILSVAVLQYIPHPALMMNEVYRLLKPGGRFVGTVAFLEPFHQSMHHFTHWGTFNALRHAGFEIKNISPSHDWSGLRAIAEMGLFPHLPNAISRCMVMPLAGLHRLWFRLGYMLTKAEQATESRRLTDNTGAFSFVVEKGNCRSS